MSRINRRRWRAQQTAVVRKAPSNAARLLLSPLSTQHETKLKKQQQTKRGCSEQQQEAAMASIHDAEREIKEALQCVESLEEMLHQAGSSAIELVVAMEEQAQRHLDHALGRVALAEHTARA